MRSARKSHFETEPERASELGTRVMARRQKPPGKENWTWDEINAGRRMSKSEKRWRRAAIDMGATKDSNAKIVPPSYEDNAQYWHLFVGILIFMIVLLAVAMVVEINKQPNNPRKARKASKSSAALNLSRPWVVITPIVC